MSFELLLSWGGPSACLLAPALTCLSTPPPLASLPADAYSADIESELGLEDSSMGRNLMAGSEVSSPPPSVGSSRSFSKKGSGGGIKKLFSKK